MAAGVAFERAQNDIMRAGRLLDARGWAPATGGNLSARLDDDSVAITVSGVHKGHLQPEDVMRVDRRGQALDGKKPSAETLLHTGFYNIRGDVGAIVHSHPRAAVAFSLIRGEARSVSLSGYELLKAFPGVKTHQATLVVPIFENSQDAPALQQEIDAWYGAQPAAPSVYLVRGHGLTAGGADLDAARYLTEATEEMLAYELVKIGVDVRLTSNGTLR